MTSLLNEQQAKKDMKMFTFSLPCTFVLAWKMVPFMVGILVFCICNMLKDKGFNKSYNPPQQKHRCSKKSIFKALNKFSSFSLSDEHRIFFSITFATVHVGKTEIL